MKKQIQNILLYILLIFFGFLMLFPIVYPLVASFLGKMEIMSGKMFPDTINFSNFLDLCGFSKFKLKTF